MWAAFTEGLAALPVADDTDLAMEADIDYDNMAPLPIAPIPDNRTTAARKCRFYLHKHERRMGWRCHQESPSADPRDPTSKRALIGFNSQEPIAELTDADTADEPGVAPLQFSTKRVWAASRQLRDIKAAGTLPEDNRIIKDICEYGGLHPVARDEVHPDIKDMLAGACRACLNQKLHPVSGAFKGWRPLGMCEKSAGLRQRRGEGRHQPLPHPPAPRGRRSPSARRRQRRGKRHRTVCGALELDAATAVGGAAA